MSIVQITPPVRELTRNLLKDMLNNNNTLAFQIEEQVWKWSRNVSATLLNNSETIDLKTEINHAHSDDANQLYEFKILQLVHNFNINGNYLKDVNVNELVWLDDAALAYGTEFQYLSHEASKHIQHLNTIIEESKEHTTINPQITTDTTFLRCRKCHSTNVVFNQKQTRAGDEGMTAFCNCQVCGTKWKM